MNDIKLIERQASKILNNKGRKKHASMVSRIMKDGANYSLGGQVPLENVINKMEFLIIRALNFLLRNLWSYLVPVF